MASTRAEDVAEVLWELKRADKVATYTKIAKRAGFSAGTNGRALHTALRAVRRGWPHLQWWRAVGEDGMILKDSEHVDKLVESGIQVQPVDDIEDSVVIAEFDEVRMEWDDQESPPEKEASTE